MEQKSGVEFHEAQVALAKIWVGGVDVGESKTVDTVDIKTVRALARLVLPYSADLTRSLLRATSAGRGRKGHGRPARGGRRRCVQPTLRPLRTGLRSSG